MVQVLEDYLIDVSEMNYTVKVRNGFTNSGEVSWKPLGYYGTMHGASNYFGCRQGTGG